MKAKLLLISLSLLLGGCASVGLRPTRIEEISRVELKDFCKRNNLKYTYQPFYENIVLYDDSLKIELKPGLSYVSINGFVENLHQKVSYEKGKVFIPGSLEDILIKFRRRRIKDLSSFIPQEIKRIVIDPGHGGRDPGAISPWGLKEKDVNLKIAKYLYSLLRKEGFRVYLTRNGDYFVSLKERVSFAKKRKADLFISIHANANPYSSRLRGFEVYYGSLKFLDTQSKILATAEELYKNNNTLPTSLKNILGKMAYQENRRRTRYLASAILDSAEKLGLFTNKVLGAPFYVLKYNICPAVLIEVGYLTNRYEEKLLRTSLYQRQLASAILQGILKLKNYTQRIIAER